MESYLPFQSNRDTAKSSTWDLPSGALKRLGRGYVKNITLSPTGDHLLVTTHIGLWVYNIPAREPLTLIEWIPGAITFSKDGKRVATTNENGVIEVWDMKGKGCLLALERAKNESVDEFIFSPDCQYLAVGGINRRYNREKRLHFSVEVWSLPKNVKIGDAPLPKERDRIYAGANPLAFSPNNRLLAFAVPEGTPEPYRPEGYAVINDKWVLTKRHIAVCEITTRQHLTTLHTFDDMDTLSFSPCGQFLAAADYKGTIYVWKVPSEFSPAPSSWSLHKMYQKSNDALDFHLVSYSPRGALRTATRSFGEGIITVSEPERSEPLYKHSKDNLHYRAYFSKGTTLAFAGGNKLHVWTLGNDRSTTISQLHAFPPHALHFSRNGQTLIAAQREDGIFSWDVTHPEQPPSIFKPTADKANAAASETYFSLGISPEGKQFVTSVDKNTVRLYEVGIDTPLAAFAIQEEVKAAAFSPPANLIACRNTANQIYIYDVTTGKLSYTYKNVDREQEGDLLFSPNGVYLSYGRCHLYDVVKREQIDGFMDDYFRFRAFSPDSAHFWDTGSPDTIELWNIQKCEEVLTLHKPEEWKQKEAFTLLPSACGRYLACSPITYQNDVNVSLSVYDIHKGTTPIATFEVPEACDTLSLAFSPDNTILACACDSGAILLWDMKPYL